jgi:hypothetical protein
MIRFRSGKEFSVVEHNVWHDAFPEMRDITSTLYPTGYVVLADKVSSTLMLLDMSPISREPVTYPCYLFYKTIFSKHDGIASKLILHKLPLPHSII